MENEREKNVRAGWGRSLRRNTMIVLSGLALSACGMGPNGEPGGGGGTTTGGDGTEVETAELTTFHRMGLIRDPATMMSANMLPMAAPPGTMPTVVDLTNQAPPPGDQGQEGSCVGWAVGYAAKSQAEIVEEGWSRTDKNDQFSPSWVYNQINHGVDQGSSISDALSLIVSKGADSIAKFPYVAGDYTRQPDADSVRRAHRYPNASWNTVAVNTSQIKNALASGRPVILAIEVRPDWDSLNRTTNQIYDSAAGALRGYHAVTLIGYDDSRQAFHVINSWGTSWGNGGYGWIAYSMTGTSVIVGAYVMTDSWNRLTAVGAPAQAVLGSQLQLAYVDDTSTNAGGKPLMHVGSSDALKAGAEAQIGGHASNAPPSMVALNGVLHAVYISANSANALLHVSSTDGVNWGTETTIGSPAHSSKAAPAITVLNGVLHVVYISNNSANALLHVSSTDGMNWGQETTIGSPRTRARPRRRSPAAAASSTSPTSPTTPPTRCCTSRRRTGSTGGRRRPWARARACMRAAPPRQSPPTGPSSTSRTSPTTAAGVCGTSSRRTGSTGGRRRRSPTTRARRVRA